MATMPQFIPSEVVHDLDFPQREAAFFYGLFLRGHSADKLRQDIEVPAVVLAKWHREAERDPQLRDIFARMVDYPPSRPGHLRYPCGFGWSPAARSVSFPFSVPPRGNSRWRSSMNHYLLGPDSPCTLVQVKNCQATKPDCQ